jgi:hypothetical protein
MTATVAEATVTAEFRHQKLFPVVANRLKNWQISDATTRDEFPLTSHSITVRNDSSDKIPLNTMR